MEEDFDKTLLIPHGKAHPFQGVDEIGIEERVEYVEGREWVSSFQISLN